MYEDLIEKIEKLYDERQDKWIYSAAYRGGWDDCIEKVIEIIKQSEPPILDMPDSEGWWWFIKEDRKYPCFVSDCIIQTFVHDQTFERDLFLKRFNGLWQKIPEPKENKKCQ
jgi:hypothetical protein